MCMRDPATCTLLLTSAPPWCLGSRSPWKRLQAPLSTPHRSAELGSAGRYRNTERACVLPEDRPRAALRADPSLAPAGCTEHGWGTTRSRRRPPSPGAALGFLARSSGSSSITVSRGQIRMRSGKCRPLHLTHLILSQGISPFAPGVERRQLAHRGKNPCGRLQGKAEFLDLFTLGTPHTHPTEPSSRTGLFAVPCGPHCPFGHPAWCHLC